MHIKGILVSYTLNSQTKKKRSPYCNTKKTCSDSHDDIVVGHNLKFDHI